MAKTVKTIGAVSYTHLDVYKRQVTGPTGWKIRSESPASKTEYSGRGTPGERLKVRAAYDGALTGMRRKNYGK